MRGPRGPALGDGACVDAYYSLRSRDLGPAIGAVLAIGSGSTLAADCLIKPNRDAPSGQHWYYRVDANRKCWFPHATVRAAAEASAIKVQSVHWQRWRAAPAADPPRRLAAPAAELQRRQADALQPPAPRSEADEAALYLEFLRWKEQHRDADEAALYQEFLHWKEQHRDAQ
jgi:hypothetical protein